MLDLIVPLVMFLAGYVLGVWTLTKANKGSVLQYVPFLGEQNYRPEVVDRSEMDEWKMEQREKHQVDGLGQI